jgi:hypothetical protein
MKTFCLFFALINYVLAFSQKETISVDSSNVNPGVIFITIKIKSEKEIFLPVETGLTFNIVSFTFFQYILETEIKGKYVSEKNKAFYDYVPEYLLMKTENVKNII